MRRVFETHMKVGLKQVGIHSKHQAKTGTFKSDSRGRKETRPSARLKFHGLPRIPRELGREPERLLPGPDCPSIIKLTFINV